MLLKIFVGAVIIVIVMVVIIAVRPSEFRVTRSATIAATPAVVFEQVNDLHKWQAWSPWARMDPDAKISFDGPQSGSGASFSWAGNDKVGEGSMTIIESRPDELVRFRLDFKKPFKGTNIAEFTFKPEGGRTLVTWTMTGKQNFMFKAVGLFMNCDKMVGDQFVTGLENLRSTVETAAKP